MRYKLLTNALLVLGISLLFILPTFLRVNADSSYPKKIDLVNQMEFIGEFDSPHCEIDIENERLFLSHNGLKVYNISNPSNLELVHESTYLAHGKIKYHNGYLFAMYIPPTVDGQVIRVFEVNENNELIFINETEKFFFTIDSDAYVNEMIFTDNNLLLTFGKSMFWCWDISDLHNITCEFSSPLTDMFFDSPIGESIDFVGLAIHPNETKMLIAGKYRDHPTGDFKLFDYSNPSNISRIDFDLDTFTSNQSTRLGTRIGLVSNGFYPCFGSGTSFLEVINWTNANQPVFGTIFQMPSSSHLLQTKMTAFSENRLLIYNILSGVVDFSKLDNIQFITEPDGSIYSLEALREPQIMNDYIFFLEDEFISGEGNHYYLSVHKINDNIVDKPNNKNLAYLALISLILIPIPFAIKKKK